MDEVFEGVISGFAILAWAEGELGAPIKNE